MNTLTEWEARQKDSGSSSSATLLSADTRSFSKPVGKTLVPKNYKLSSTREIYTMVALEKVLETNPTPLLHFASYRDFSGENISFLNCVRHWKASWQPRQGERRSVPLNSEYQTLRRQYATAVEIYSSYVSPQYSEFPVNLSSTHLKELNRIFSDAAAKVNCAVEHHPATPFESVTPGMHSNSSYTKGDLEPGYGHELKSFSVTSAPCDDKNFEENNGNFSRHGDTESYVSARQSTHGKMEVRLPSDFPIPESFDPTVFDRAEASIKYLVLTSTWPKFIAAGHPNMPAKKGPLEITKEFLQQRLKRRSNMERLV
ncbi:hypothetical protein H2198_003047 [Neophaeococcomyces mojaviensis]|uniref:Uncharacterized protein n=1 Tax=Neophaeococcomyces mojaviensis TaxID=3383035 RepID=A0ACC3AD18_9EURO|nr:hypothetical protein H2198_003047 [Knufia sp. JES_112]